MPTGCWSLTLPNRVPTSLVSVPTTAKRCPSTSYARPACHRTACRAKKSAISARPRASSSLHMRCSALAADVAAAESAIAISTRIACCTSALAWSILVTGTSSFGGCQVWKLDYPQPTRSRLSITWRGPLCFSGDQARRAGPAPDTLDHAIPLRSKGYEERHRGEPVAGHEHARGIRGLERRQGPPSGAPRHFMP